MDWFLIKQNEHLGPFSEQTLQELFQSGEFTQEDLVWKDGWADAKTYGEVFLEKDDFAPVETQEFESIDIPEHEDEIIKYDELPPDLPPDLPPLPTDINDYEDEIYEPAEAPHSGEVPKNYVHTAEPIATDVKFSPVVDESVEQESEQEGEQVTEQEVVDFNEFEFAYEKDEKVILSRVKIFFVAAIFVFVAWAGYLYLADKSVKFDRPSTMSLLDYERLSAVAMADNTKLEFSFSLASDKKTLWASTNNPLKGEVFVTLTSKKGRVLGRDVEVKAKGILKQKLITFKDFQFIKGNKFFDGYYDVEIFTVDDLSVPLFQTMFKPTDKQFRFLDEFLITSMNKEDFENQLALRAERKLENADEFWAEVYQKYTTMISITKKIRQGFEKVYRGDSQAWEQNIKNFRSDYAKEYGIFFTEFVKSNEASFEKLIDKDFEDRINIIANYQRLSKLAKNIGVETMSLLAKMEAQDPTSFEKDVWEANMKTALSPFDLIISECERKLAVLNQN